MPDHLILPPFGSIELDKAGAAADVGEMPTPWFGGRPVPVSLRRLRPGDGELAEAALRAFAALDLSTCVHAERLLLDRCHDVLDDRGADTPLEREMSALDDPEAVWRHARDPRLVVAGREHPDGRALDVCLTLECDWDAEHGASLTFLRGSKLIGVGGADDPL